MLSQGNLEHMSAPGNHTHRRRHLPGWRAWLAFNVLLVALAGYIQQIPADPIAGHLRALCPPVLGKYDGERKHLEAWLAARWNLSDDLKVAILQASLSYRPLTQAGKYYPDFMDALQALVGRSPPLRQRIVAEVLSPALQHPPRDLGARIVLVALATHFGATDPALPPLVLRTLQDAMARQYEQENQPWRDNLRRLLSLRLRRYYGKLEFSGPDTLNPHDRAPEAHALASREIHAAWLNHLVRSPLPPNYLDREQLSALMALTQKSLEDATCRWLDDATYEGEDMGFVSWRYWRQIRVAEYWQRRLPVRDAWLSAACQEPGAWAREGINIGLRAIMPARRKVIARWPSGVYIQPMEVEALDRLIASLLPYLQALPPDPDLARELLRRLPAMAEYPLPALHLLWHLGPSAPEAALLEPALDLSPESLAYFHTHLAKIWPQPVGLSDDDPASLRVVWQKLRAREKLQQTVTELLAYRASLAAGRPRNNSGISESQMVSLVDNWLWKTGDDEGLPSSEGTRTFLLANFLQSSQDASLGGSSVPRWVMVDMTPAQAKPLVENQLNQLLLKPQWLPAQYLREILLRAPEPVRKQTAEALLAALTKAPDCASALRLAKIFAEASLEDRYQRFAPKTTILPPTRASLGDTWREVLRQRWYLEWLPASGERQPLPFSTDLYHLPLDYQQEIALLMLESQLRRQQPVTGALLDRWRKLLPGDDWQAVADEAMACLSQQNNLLFAFVLASEAASTWSRLDPQAADRACQPFWPGERGSFGHLWGAAILLERWRPDLMTPAPWPPPPQDNPASRPYIPSNEAYYAAFCRALLSRFLPLVVSRGELQSQRWQVRQLDLLRIEQLASPVRLYELAEEYVTLPDLALLDLCIPRNPSSMILRKTEASYTAQAILDNRYNSSLFGFEPWRNYEHLMGHR